LFHEEVHFLAPLFARDLWLIVCVFSENWKDFWNFGLCELGGWVPSTLLPPSSFTVAPQCLWYPEHRCFPGLPPRTQLSFSQPSHCWTQHGRRL